MSLPERVFFSNSILNLHDNRSLSRALLNSLINSTTQALFTFLLILDLVKNTLETRSFGDGPITTISFPPGSKRGSPNSSQKINSNYLNTGVNCSLLSPKKTNSLSSAVVLASFVAVLDLVGYQCGILLLDLDWLE